MQNINDVLQPQRLDGESFDDYRTRRRHVQIVLRDHQRNGETQPIRLRPIAEAIRRAYPR